VRMRDREGCEIEEVGALKTAVGGCCYVEGRSRQAPPAKCRQRAEGPGARDPGHAHTLALDVEHASIVVSQGDGEPVEVVLEIAPNQAWLGAQLDAPPPDPAAIAWASGNRRPSRTVHGLSVPRSSGQFNLLQLS
jgi:hypothetical protein